MIMTEKWVVNYFTLRECTNQRDACVAAAWASADQEQKNEFFGSIKRLAILIVWIRLPSLTGHHEFWALNALIYALDIEASSAFVCTSLHFNVL